jgi:hypothetical protein
VFIPLPKPGAQGAAPENGGEPARLAAPASAAS